MPTHTTVKWRNHPHLSNGSWHNVCITDLSNQISSPIWSCNKFQKFNSFYHDTGPFHLLLHFYWSSVQNIFCSIMVSFLLFRVNFFSFQTFGSLAFNLIALWAEDVDLILFLRKYCDLIHNQFLGVPCIIENNVFSI